MSIWNCTYQKGPTCLIVPTEKSSNHLLVESDCSDSLLRWETTRPAGHSEHYAWHPFDPIRTWPAEKTLVAVWIKWCRSTWSYPSLKIHSSIQIKKRIFWTELMGKMQLHLNCWIEIKMINQSMLINWLWHLWCNKITVFLKLWLIIGGW